MRGADGMWYIYGTSGGKQSKAKLIGCLERNLKRWASLSLVCCQLLIEGTMGVNCGHEQSMCSLDKSVSCPQVMQCMGLSGKKHCLYSLVGAWLVMQCVMRAMVVMESLAAKVKKFAFGLLRMLGWKHFHFHLVASHCCPLYSCAAACTFHQESMSWM